jgi:hypothetical protein
MSLAMQNPLPRSGRLRAWWSGHLGRRLVAELFLITSVFVVYRQIRYLSRNDTSAALAHADRVVDIERRFHVFSERGVQRLVMNSDTVITFLNRYYVTVHFSLTTAFLVWVYWRHQATYRRIRNWFVSVTLAALVIHVAYPLAPPRMLADAGFVDTLQQYGPRIYSTDTTQSIANQFAAMPSLHFGWAVMVAGAFISIKRTRRSLLALLHPGITLLAIVATANHYWIDAAVAMLLVVAAAAMIRLADSSSTSPVGPVETAMLGPISYAPCPTPLTLPTSTGGTYRALHSSGTSTEAMSSRSTNGKTCHRRASSHASITSTDSASAPAPCPAPCPVT